MTRTIANFTFATELLEDLIDDDLPQDTTLVICSTKRAFLRQIAPSILKPQAQEIPASQEGLDEDEGPQETLPHRFLVPTLGLVAAARALKLAFCPTVKSLRAFVSTFTASTQLSSVVDSDVNRSLVVVDLLLLHRNTSDFSAQGLSRTFASVVEAASRNGVDLRLVECKDFHNVHDSNRGYDLWAAEVPLLSGSVRLGGNGVNWAARAINIHTIASRWFRFEETVAEVTGVSGEAEDEEMLV
jgi:hypothetical protein